MSVFEHLAFGFSTILNPANLLLCFIGVFLGTLIGVLPGIGPSGTIALLLPMTLKMTPVGAIIMYAAIYYGSMYGGSTTSILVKIPGEAACAITCLDGYQMACKGEAGKALGIAAFGSFIAGTLSIVGLMLVAPPLANMALRFGPPEYFSIMCLGLTILIYLSSGSPVKALMMAAFGMILGCIGQDPETGTVRFVYGIRYLLDGIGLVPFLMGLFGISEIFMNIEKPPELRQVYGAKVQELFPNQKDWALSTAPIMRGTVLGFLLGVLPGGGGIVSSFASYAMEKRISKHPERFGTGAIEGVAGPESANNAAATGNLVPLLTLGIPCNAVMAILLGALMIQGVTPGPLLMSSHPEIFWGVVASMYVGNMMLLVLNLPLIPMWVQVLKIPYKILFPLILLFCLIGAFSLNNNVFDVGVMLFFGVVGYLMQKYGYEGAPLVLAFILGPMLETSLRQSLLISDGSLSIFFTRPISGGIFLIIFLLIGLSGIPFVANLKRRIPKED